MRNQLEWQPVQAPRLDTRGLAIAGQTVDNAFGRFADILNARDARLNKKATDSAAAQLLAAQTPEEIAALQAKAAAGGFGDRADMRDIAVAGNQRQEALLQNAARQQQMDIGQEDLLNKQDMAQFSDQYTTYDQLMAAGKRDEAAALGQQIKANGGGRNLYEVGKDGEKLFGDFRDAAERHRVNESNISNDNARTSIAREQFNLTQQDRQNLRDADTFAVGFAQNARLLDSTSAAAALHQSPEYRAMTAPARAQADQSFTSAYGQLTGATGFTDTSLAPISSEAAAVQSALKASEARLANAQLTPLARATREASVDQPDLTRQKAVEMLHPLVPNWWESGTDGHLQAVLDAVPGARLEDVVTAAKNFQSEPGFWATLGTNQPTYDNIIKHTKDIVANRAKGYGQNYESDLAMDTAPLQAKSAEITKLQGEQVRWLRAIEAGDPGTKSAAAQAQHAKADARLRELLASQPPQTRQVQQQALQGPTPALKPWDPEWLLMNSGARAR